MDVYINWVNEDFFPDLAEIFFCIFWSSGNKNLQKKISVFESSVTLSHSFSFCVNNFTTIHAKQSVCTPKLLADSYQILHAILFGF